jgi:hypothetical protein
MFSKEELELINVALNSHEYWQLTEAKDRRDGESQVPDGLNPEIDACRKLQDKILSLSSAMEKAGGPWGTFPNFPVKDWQAEVEAGDTRLGYWEWVAKQATTP